MGFRAVRGIILLGLVFLAGPSGRAATLPDDDFRIQRLPAHGLSSRDAVETFYAARAGAPVWTPGRPARAHLVALMIELNRAEAEGLDPDDFHLRILNPLTLRPERMLSPAERVRRDILLTDALFTFGRRLAGDGDAPDAIHGEPRAAAHDLRPVERLATALEIGEDLRSLLGALRPAHPAYAGLRRELSRYRVLAARGDWPRVPDGPALHPGDVDPRVAVLRDRLAAEGYGGVRTEGDPQLYDEALTGAVRYAQARLGLADDGVVGPATLAALDVPARDRVAQIELNLERLRGLPRGDGVEGPALVVNIPAFTLEVIEDGRTVMRQRAIVGRTDRPTPVLTGSLTWLEVNPYWNIPMKLARRDVLPRIRRDSTYLAERDIRVYESWRSDAPEVEPASVDWQALESWDMAYKLRQSPGPTNPLGRVKFVFDNPYRVYIHDTPGRDKFAATRRAFSSGCVRVEDPLALATYLLDQGEPGDDAGFREAYDARINRRLGLPRPVPVHLVYLTAWTDGEGVLHFREDVYGYDAPRREALAAR